MKNVRKKANNGNWIEETIYQEQGKRVAKGNTAASSLAEQLARQTEQIGANSTRGGKVGNESRTRVKNESPPSMIIWCAYCR